MKVVLMLLFVTISGFKLNPGDGSESKSESNVPQDPPPLESFTTPEIIRYMGYPAEVHEVVTDDGYVLELHRIPHGKADFPQGGATRPVAFLQHCLLCSSADWVMDKPDRALAYLLADAGYDVWMNNVRGNTYSRKHVTLDPDKNKKKFWEFTWDQMAASDVPAAMDFALRHTGTSQLYYVGFSMGTTVFFALMNEKPEYANKIKVAALMGPVAYTEHMKGPLTRILAEYSDRIDLAMSFTGHYEFLPSSDLMDYLAENFCALEDKTSPICYNILFLIAGFDRQELNKEYTPIILSHTPAGTSFHTNHYGQMIKPGVFQKYDWGVLGNQKHYNSNTPPPYFLNITTPPVGLFWGQNDWLASPEDAARIASEMRNVVANHKVEWERWNHLDFVWGIHAKEYVYDYVMELLAKY